MEAWKRRGGGKEKPAQRLDVRKGEYPEEGCNRFVDPAVTSLSINHVSIPSPITNSSSCSCGTISRPALGPFWRDFNLNIGALLVSASAIVADVPIDKGNTFLVGVLQQCAEPVLFVLKLLDDSVDSLLAFVT